MFFPVQIRPRFTKPAVSLSSFRPATKKSSALRLARRVKYTPIPSAAVQYTPNTAQSAKCTPASFQILTAYTRKHNAYALRSSFAFPPRPCSLRKTTMNASPLQMSYALRPTPKISAAVSPKIFRR